MLPSNLLPIYQKDDFLFFKDNKKDELIIDTSRINLISAYMNKNHLKNITINSIYYPVNDLAFLKYLPFIQSISIVDNHHDISLINDLKELREIKVSGFKGQIDFNNFSNLEVLNVEWSNKLKNLRNALNLKWLWLDNYKGNSLEEFKNFNNLVYLYLHKPSIVSLNGIGGMLCLNNLNIDTAIKLVSLNALEEKLNHLETLCIYLAKQLTDYTPLSKIVSLRHLELRKTGETNSIDFIKSLKNLEKVVLGFKVLDGNMNYLDGVKDVGFIDFPHYSRKMKDFTSSR